MAILELTSDDSEPEYVTDRRSILEQFIRQVVHALGGYEPDVGYCMGDEANGCLKDLKKLWRKDDTDDDRTIARIFLETRILPSDLVPILLATPLTAMTAVPCPTAHSSRKSTASARSYTLHNPYGASLNFGVRDRYPTLSQCSQRLLFNPNLSIDHALTRPHSIHTKHSSSCSYNLCHRFLAISL